MERETENYIVGSYLVAYLDVLGQRERLRELPMPRTAEEFPAFQETLKGTAGIVLDLRRLFRKYFEWFAAGITSPEIGKAAQVINFRGFSDSFVVSVPLKDEEPWRYLMTPVVASYSTLFAACSVMIASLASKHALRGGIDVGWGVNIAEGEIYGAALARAHFLESRKANYPRVLIGDELWRFLSLGLEATQNVVVPAARVVHELIRQQMNNLIIVDSDGHRALDYLGQGVRIHAGPNYATASIQPAYEFVLEQHEHWLSTENTKLSERYANLRRYFESRLPLWVSAPTEEKPPSHAT